MKFNYLSLIIPGSGLFLKGQKQKGLIVFAVSLMLLVGFFLTDSFFAAGLLLFAFTLTLVSSFLDYKAHARGKPPQITDSKPFILLMLLTTGMTALPFLWTSRCFSKNSKGWLSFFVCAVGIGFLFFIVTSGRAIETFLIDLLN